MTDPVKVAALLYHYAEIEERILVKCDCPFSESHELKRDVLLDAAAAMAEVAA